MRLEQLPVGLACFDTVFSMGVIYHHKNPSAHINDLYQALTPGGELVLETLVMPPEHPTLAPTERYARMRNISLIPNSATLSNWLNDAGFTHIQVVSEEQTSLSEQRTTSWMPFESLKAALEPETGDSGANSTLTIEGYPAPRRSIVVAKRP